MSGPSFPQFINNTVGIFSNPQHNILQLESGINTTNSSLKNALHPSRSNSSNPFEVYRLLKPPNISQLRGFSFLNLVKFLVTSTFEIPSQPDRSSSSRATEPRNATKLFKFTPHPDKCSLLQPPSRDSSNRL
ncbi:conserved hypothetical protein, unlikely [Trypanosoma brucei gambiense DAL972]|uniref:Uncharacterized protein n=1 Tax=Trypanosoma brucei gambiense (strain MHOM/CI/86/DAL972) TaxID=679716 RepID=C9ZWZ2_TRYB9|nr:conserved hypothetical protein, unlikely [Trypanosoma brucei gambiense DAL972]CBH13933.1 conserved hypothetical protein, unlikely [Trypanosoma brucei gambiense DAL972]|eukprot:XP_011776207.1 conserved hypothetical protein, unlikely [Trypanosoma brucei gambiense DAL972]